MRGPGHHASGRVQARVRRPPSGTRGRGWSCSSCWLRCCSACPSPPCPRRRGWRSSPSTSCCIQSSKSRQRTVDFYLTECTRHGPARPRKRHEPAGSGPGRGASRAGLPEPSSGGGRWDGKRRRSHRCPDAPILEPYSHLLLPAMPSWEGLDGPCCPQSPFQAMPEPLPTLPCEGHSTGRGRSRWCRASRGCACQRAI